MIEKIVFNLAIFGVIILGVCHGKALNSNEADARKFLKERSDKLFNLYDKIGNQSLVEGDVYDLREDFKMMAKFFAKFYEDLRKFEFENFKDKELKYAFERLVKEEDLKILGEKPSLKLYDTQKELEDLPHEEDIDNFQDDSFKVSYSPEIEKVMETSNDPKELQYYWSEWRKKAGEWAENHLDDTLEAIKQEAELNEKSPLEYWNDDAFNITDMENLMTNIQPLYMELHGFVRNQLQKKYGESIIASDGLIPDHLFRQIYHQLSTNQSVIEDIVPVEGLPSFDSDKLTGRQLYKIVETFFEGLGFEKFTSSFWKDQVKTLEENDEHHCQAKSWSWSTTKYLQICDHVDFEQFLIAYAHMSDLYYAKEMEGIPAYFFYPPSDLNKGIERALILSASTLHNLNAYKLNSDDFKITEKAKMDRLLTMAITNLLLYQPYNFVHAKVMADLLSGKVKKAELNKHYWQLLAKYAGVGPPKDHKTDTYDLPIDFYSGMIDNDMSTDFSMEILSYQIYKKLCELSGNYPKEPLHLCDISGSKEAGDALRKMMKLGASKPFNEVLASMFPENPTIMAEGLLEYYSPIKKFLAEKNKEANRKPGWKSSDKK